MEKKKYEKPNVEMLELQLTDPILASVDQDQEAEDIPGVGSIQSNFGFDIGGFKK